MRLVDWLLEEPAYELTGLDLVKSVRYCRTTYYPVEVKIGLVRPLSVIKDVASRRQRCKTALFSSSWNGKMVTLINRIRQNDSDLKSNQIDGPKECNLLEWYITLRFVESLRGLTRGMSLDFKVCPGHGYGCLALFWDGNRLLLSSQLAVNEDTKKKTATRLISLVSQGTP